MRVHIASDHAGYELKAIAITHLENNGHEVIDHGALTYDPQDDYPSFCFEAAQATGNDPGSLGIVIGGSGNGEQSAANKVRGARAALAWNLQTARLAREHNNANVVGIGARMHTSEEALEIIAAFLSEPYSNEPRHQRRIEILADLEA